MAFLYVDNQSTLFQHIYFNTKLWSLSHNGKHTGDDDDDDHSFVLKYICWNKTIDYPYRKLLADFWNYIC